MLAYITSLFIIIIKFHRLEDHKEVGYHAEGSHTAVAGCTVVKMADNMTLRVVLMAAQEWGHM